MNVSQRLPVITTGKRPQVFPAVTSRLYFVSWERESKCCIICLKGDGKGDK